MGTIVDCREEPKPVLQNKPARLVRCLGRPLGKENYAVRSMHQSHLDKVIHHFYASPYQHFLYRNFKKPKFGKSCLKPFETNKVDIANPFSIST